MEKASLRGSKKDRNSFLEVQDMNEDKRFHFHHPITRLSGHTMNRILRVKWLRLVGFTFLVFGLILTADISGVFRHLQEKSFQEFSYPLEAANFIEIVEQFRLGENVEVPPINTLYSSITINADSIDKCRADHSLSLLVLVKSAPFHSKNRDAIRETWKMSTLENNGKLIFFIGDPSAEDIAKEEGLIQAINLESQNHKDIVRLGFQDSYYNNTIKTMLEMRWAAEQCSNFSFALLVDDDYFVSIKNLLKYVNSPEEYPKTSHLTKSPDKLYAGYRMFPPPHRHKIFTKWYMPLDEYPYDYFPPYITAGAILLSQTALFDIFYASYYTVHFRFDDIYVAICAKKMNITPTHSEYFRFWTTRDESPEEHLIASHGFFNPVRLKRFWSTQKSEGFC